MVSKTHRVFLYFRLDKKIYVCQRLTEETRRVCVYPINHKYQMTNFTDPNFIICETPLP